MATKRLLSLLGSVLVCAPGVAFSDNDTRLVDCTKGHSIQKAIDKRNPERSLTLVIRGACNENVTVDRDDLALVGERPMGADSVLGTISIPGSRRVLIRNLTVSSPSGAGVEGTDNAAFAVEDSFLVRNATEGLAVRSNAFATVKRSHLDENGQAAPPDSGRGIDARNGGAVDASDSTIANNRSDGVGAFNNAYVRLSRNTIEGNGRRDAGEAGIQVNRSRVRGQSNTIRNNTGISGLIIVNHADYRTGTGLSALDFPDNDGPFEQIQHPSGVHNGQQLLAIDVNNASFGDFRQVTIVGTVSAGDHSYVQVRGDQVGGLTCSSIEGNVQVSGRHGLLRLRGVKTTPPVPAGVVTIPPFGLRETDNSACP
jgi:hypothetical protein